MINKEVYPPFFLVLKIKKICIIKKEVIDLEKMSAFEIKNILNKHFIFSIISLFIFIVNPHIPVCLQKSRMRSASASLPH